MSQVDLPIRATFALEHLQRICASMFELELRRRGQPELFDSSHLTFGACINLVGESAVWELALFGDEAGCSSLARVIFALEPEQVPAADEIVDAMGEVINIVSGAVKTQFNQQEHERVTIGIPTFLVSAADCAKYETRIVPRFQQAVIADQLEGKLCLVWCEKSPVGLLEEARACLASADDKLSLSDGLSALHELAELLAEATAAENAAALEQCQQLVTDIINEHDRGALEFAVAIIDALHEAVREDLLLPLKMPRRRLSDRSQSDDDASASALVERDAETLEMLGEFLGESQDALEKCDGLLLEVEAGRGVTEAVAALFRHFHTIKGVASFHGLPDVEHLAHTTEHLLASVRNGERILNGSALDLVFEATTTLARTLDAVRQAVADGRAFPTSKAARFVAERIESLLKGEVVTTAEARTSGRLPVAKREPAAPLKETVKIEVDQLDELDRLLPAIGSAAQLLDASAAHSEDCRQARERLLALQEQAQAILSRMRMVPVRGLFQKLARLVRDLAKKTEKLAQFEQQGEETRVDRSVAEKLNGPLVHMIRNAIDHGIEGGEQRRQAGKPLIGTIRLAAKLEANRVVVELSDDGKGLDADAIFVKAKSRGLLTTDERPADSALFALIFEPGFSTAAQVTAISGRGVGMDVVRREVEALGGRIEIDSARGRGSRFRIVLPQRA